MLEEGADALFAVAGHGGVLGAAELEARFLVYFFTVLHDGRGEHVGARALHDAAERYYGEDEGDKSDVRHEHVAWLGLGAVLPTIPALPIFPVGIVDGVVARRPLPLLWRPVVGRRLRGGLVVAFPAVAPRIVRFPLCIVGEDGVGGDEQAVALQADGVRNVGYRGVAAVWVVQLDEGVEAVFRIGITAAAVQDLVGRRRLVGMDRVRPGQVGVVVMRRRRRCVLGVGARVPVGGRVRARAT